MRAAEPGAPYPPTRTTQASDVIHGFTVKDPYRWLEDEKSPEVQAWMTAQDGFTRQRLASLPGRDALAARLKELLYVDSLGAPLHRGTRYFYARRLASKEKSIGNGFRRPSGGSLSGFRTTSSHSSLHLAQSFELRRLSYLSRNRYSPEATVLSG